MRGLQSANYYRLRDSLKDKKNAPAIGSMLQRYNANTKTTSVATGGLEQIESIGTTAPAGVEVSANPEIRELKEMQVSIQQQLHEMQSLLFSKFGHGEQMPMGGGLVYQQTGKQPELPPLDSDMSMAAFNDRVSSSQNEKLNSLVNKKIIHPMDKRMEMQEQQPLRPINEHED